MKVGLEARQIKAMVEGMKEELTTARKSQSEADFMTLWETRNNELRNLGIRTLPLPE